MTRQKKIIISSPLKLKDFKYTTRGINGEYIKVDTKTGRKKILHLEGTVSKDRKKLERDAKRNTFNAKDVKYKRLLTQVTNSSDRTLKLTLKKPTIDPKTGFTKDVDVLAPNVEMDGRDPLLGTAVDFYVGNKFIKAASGLMDYGANKAAGKLWNYILKKESQKPYVRWATPEEEASFMKPALENKSSGLIPKLSTSLSVPEKKIVHPRLLNGRTGLEAKRLPNLNKTQQSFLALKEANDLNKPYEVLQQSNLESPYIDVVEKSINNSLIVNPDGSVNPRMLVRGLLELKNQNPTALSYKNIFNKDSFGNRTNLKGHTEGVVSTALLIPVPTGYTRQDLVQAALYHDIGKTIDLAQGIHEEIGANMLQNVLNSKNGIMPVLRIKKDVIDAINKHGDSHHMVETSPLTQALHVADVARGLSYDQAALRFPQLFTYPREFPQFNFQEIPLRDELKRVINPLLKRQGYETIDLSSTREEAEKQLENIIDQHNTFVRSVRGAKNIDEGAQWVSEIPPITNGDGGRRGFSGLRSRYGVNKQDYDASYMSTSSDIASAYGDSNGRFVVGLPRTQESVNSPSLSERLLAGDFELYDSEAVASNKPPIGKFSMLELPYRLLTGRSLLSDMKKEGFIKPTLKRPLLDLNLIDDEGYVFNKELGRAVTLRDKLSRINKTLTKYGFNEIKPINEKYDEFGQMISPGMAPRREIDRLQRTIAYVEDFDKYVKIYDKIEPQLKTVNSISRKISLINKKIREYRTKLNRLQSDNMDKLQISPGTPLGFTFENNELQNEYIKLNKILDKLEDENIKYTNIYDHQNSDLYYMFKKFGISDDLFYSTLLNVLSVKQRLAFALSKNPKYVDIKKIISQAKKLYFENYKKYYKSRMTMKQPTQLEMLDYMRDKGVRPKFEYKTFNHIRTFTPNEHRGDAPKKLKTKNQHLDEGLIAIIGRRGEKKVTIKKPITRDEIYKDVKKEKRDRSYKDYGPRIKSVKLSRKTLE